MTEFGAYRSESFSHRLGDDGPTTDEILAGLLSDPPAADSPVVSVIDLATEGDLPPTAGVLINYENRARLIVRPSGTEPKVKFYLEAVGDPENAEKALRGLAHVLQERL